MTIEGKSTTVAFKLDTGAPDIFVPLSMIDAELSDTYHQRKRKARLTSPSGERLNVARFENVHIHLPMEPPFVDREILRVQTGLWVSEDIKCGLLGMPFLEQFGLLVLNFPQVEGPYERGPHFGLLERPDSPLLLEEPGGRAVGS